MRTSTAMRMTRNHAHSRWMRSGARSSTERRRTLNSRAASLNPRLKELNPTNISSELPPPPQTDDVGPRCQRAGLLAHGFRNSFHPRLGHEASHAVYISEFSGLPFWYVDKGWCRFYAVYAPPPWSGKRKRDLVAFKIDWRCSTVVEFEYLTFRGNLRYRQVISYWRIFSFQLNKGFLQRDV